MTVRPRTPDQAFALECIGKVCFIHNTTSCSVDEGDGDFMRCSCSAADEICGILDQGYIEATSAYQKPGRQSWHAGGVDLNQSFRYQRPVAGSSEILGLGNVVSGDMTPHPLSSILPPILDFWILRTDDVERVLQCLTALRWYSSVR